MTTNNVNNNFDATVTAVADVSAAAEKLTHQLLGKMATAVPKSTQATAVPKSTQATAAGEQTLDVVDQLPTALWCDDDSAELPELTYCDNIECAEYAAPGRDYCVDCLPSFENTCCTLDNQSDGYAGKLDPEDHISMLGVCLSEFHTWYDELFELGYEELLYTFDELLAEWMDFSKSLDLPEHERDAYFHRVPEDPIDRNRIRVMFLPVGPAIEFQETKPGSLEIHVDENSIARHTGVRAPPMQTHDFKLNSVVEVFGLVGDFAKWNGRAGFVSYENEIMEHGTPCVEVNFGSGGKRAVPRDNVRAAGWATSSLKFKPPAGLRPFQ